MKPSKKPGGKSSKSGKRKPSGARATSRKKSTSDLPVQIVGIGASAGGLEAFRLLLEALPATTGMAYVLVQHLDPRHESMLAELLNKSAKMPVIEVTRRTPIKPDHVYVIPPGKNMAIEHSTLTLSPRVKQRGAVNMPIDQFFLSLAAARTARAIGVVLSGTATDGTAGLRAIKEAGGVAFVQDETAKYQGMPQSAISAGVADHVLPPHKIAGELVELVTHPLIDLPDPKVAEEDAGETADYSGIISELQRATGTDFSHYKVSTLRRRIERRMLVNKMMTQRKYLAFLRKHPKEAEALFNDILISVTSFFRDPATLQCLTRKVLPQLLKHKESGGPLRIWVPGCATGEEVYSLAITVLEFFDDRSIDAPLQIFGTDLSAAVIEKARRGTYTKSDVSGISARRLERFFHKINGVYQIQKELRDMCVFSVHDLLKDPPFSRMDIISCCNVLIYMDTTLQRRILPGFHYGLAEHGALILGKSETAGASSDLFTQVEKKNKVFVKKEGVKKRVPQISRHNVLSPHASKPHATWKSHVATDETDVQDDADAILLQRFVPASVIINADFEVLQFRGDTEEYLALPSGKATLSLLKIAREELTFGLRETIRKAKKTRTAQKTEIEQSARGRTRTVVIEVFPLNTSDETYFLVVFAAVPPQTEDAAQSPSQSNASAAKSSKVADRRIKQMEKELAKARESARASIEEHETIVNELQSANEEILSSNEELQSINEELETSTEELESTNEELNIVNQELQTRNEDLTEARDYSESIIATIRTPLLVLDRELRVITANHAFCSAFRTTQEATEGHFLYELGNHQWDIPELRSLLTELLPRKRIIYDYEIAHNFPSIGRRIYHLNAQVLDQKHQRKLILLAFEDVTEIQEASRKKDEFIGIASHEIRTPVTTIKTLTELLQKQLSNSVENDHANILEHITTQSNRLMALVTNLLDFNQLQAGRLVLHSKSLDLDKLIERTVRAIEHSAPEHTFVIEGGVQQRVVADPARIEQVLTNLLTNAIKYSPDGKQIVVRTQVRGQETVVSVQDFGAGIEKKYQETIFDRFYQEQKGEYSEESEKSKGFGLGLYISAEIIRQHGGKIWVESEHGKGSTFYFTLPIPQKTKKGRVRRS